LLLINPAYCEPIVEDSIANKFSFPNDEVHAVVIKYQEDDSAANICTANLGKRELDGQHLVDGAALIDDKYLTGTATPDQIYYQAHTEIDGTSGVIVIRHAARSALNATFRVTGVSASKLPLSPN
jgi:hypothetical protein